MYATEPVHPATDSVELTVVVPESCTSCGGDSVYEHGGDAGSAFAGAAPAIAKNAAAAVKTIDRTIPGS
jgi:hypothetical protein